MDNLLAFIAAKEVKKWNSEVHYLFLATCMEQIPTVKAKIEFLSTFGMGGNSSGFGQAMRRKHNDKNSEYHGKLPQFMTAEQEVDATLVKLNF